MSDFNKNAKIAGLSFLISYLGLILGGFFLAPILEAPDYLANVYPNATQVGVGVLLESVNGIAVIGIAVMLFPILKRYNEGIALAYLGFRGVEAMLSILGSTLALPLIELSHEYIQAGAPADSYFDVLGILALAQRHWAMEMLTVFFILGALIFYFLLYRTAVVPRFISVWGMIAILCLTGFNVLLYTGIDLGIAVTLILVLPIMANEIFIAVWLIVKGFDSSTILKGAT
ncbi:MAG: DUF4386 domain-containing protein [Candidatus Thorarchaeota archaeon]|nr:DUF4386 domain-containing protein [Candidatus Thorarchaeota archaeon]